MDEVDSFLDSVEATIAELSKALAQARDQEIVQRSQIERLQERLAKVTDPPTAPMVLGQDPLVREVRERLRRTLMEQLALLDQFAETQRTSPDQPTP
jgi:uncharacterized coiled-coil protein SlyX